MKYLCRTTEEYHVTSENEAIKVIEEAKADKRFQVLKSTTDYKTIKVKGEVEGEYWVVKITKQFTDLKEPDCTVKVTYDIDEGVFPSPIIAESAFNDGEYEDDIEEDEE